MSTVTEPTTDQKIELLVRSVLEAVDARLDAVRHELASFAAEAEQRHHHLLESVAALDARVSALPAAPVTARPATASSATPVDVVALQQALAELRTDVNALAGHIGSVSAPLPTPATGAPVADAVTTGRHQITRAELDEISRPIVTHITTQVPIVPDPTGHHEPHAHLPLTVPPAVAPTFTQTPGGDHGPAGDDSIDLDQLASLLTERLGHLSLPNRPD